MEEEVEEENENMRRMVVFSLTCVRHGETNANREKRIQGHLDVPLSPNGETQALQAGMRLSQDKFSRVYASDLCRAHVTCQRILEKNKTQPPTIRIDKRLRERNFGAVEGFFVEEVKKMAAESGTTFIQYIPEGAESQAEVQERIVSFFKELCQSVYDKNNQHFVSVYLPEEAPTQNGSAEKFNDTLTEIQDTVAERVLVVSHGAVLKQLYIHLNKTLGCHVPGLPDSINCISPNTGISEFIIRFCPKKYDLYCVKFHDAQHLEFTPDDVPGL